jgi:uncharacterized protein (TIGR03437 family)
MRRILFTAVCTIILSLGPLFGQGTTLMGLGNVSQPAITVAPGQIMTLLVSNPKTVLPATSAHQATTLPLPTSLAGFSVSIRDYMGTHPAAILAITQSPLCQLNRTSPDCLVTALQIQIPFELTWSEDPPTGVDLIVNDNGTQSEPFILAARSDNIHVLTTCEISGGGLSNGIWAAFPPCTGLVQHSDGSVVSSNLPAKPGEVVVIYALGMGTTIPAVATGATDAEPCTCLGCAGHRPSNSNPSVRLQAECNAITSLCQPFFTGTDARIRGPYPR